MSIIEERWIKREVETNHSGCYASKHLLCECCGLASAHFDVEGVSLCCVCVAAETLEEQRSELKELAQKAAETYDERRATRLRLIADKMP